MILSITNNNKFEKLHHMKEEDQTLTAASVSPIKPEDVADSSNRFSVVSDTVSERSLISSTYSDFDFTYSSSDDEEVVELQLKDEKSSDTTTGVKEEKSQRSSSAAANATEEYEVPELNKENIEMIANNSNNNQTEEGDLRKSSKVKVHRRHVSFDSVRIRRYPIVLGDNPCVHMGAPVSIGWEYDELPELDLEDFESIRRKTRRTKLRDLLLNFYQRRDVLLRCGYSQEEQEQVTKEISKIRWQRMKTTALLPVSKIEEIAQSAKRKVKRRIMNNNKKKTSSSASSTTSISVVIAATSTNNINNSDDEGMWL